MGVIKRIRDLFSKENIKTNQDGAECEKDNEARQQTTDPFNKSLGLSQDEKEMLFETLTPREKETCLLLIGGCTLRETAEQLSVSYSTANTYQASIYRKLGVKTKAELIINYRDIRGFIT